ncbi:MAG: PDZ domain-containing protein [Clostridiaceae bacterium]|nr:PDZ domain-containing protein [Clostridiaceae bacterium]
MDENMNLPEQNNTGRENEAPDRNNSEPRPNQSNSNEANSAGWSRSDDRYTAANRGYDSAVYPQGRYQRPNYQAQQSATQYTREQPPVQQNNQPYQSAGPQRNQDNGSRGAKIAGFIALGLAITVLMSSLTGITVYKVMSDRIASPTAVSTTQPIETTAEQANEPGATENPIEGTDRHFSIEDAAKRQDDDRKSLSTMEIAAIGRPAVVAISTETTMTDMFGRTGPVEAAGSGFIITEDGYIVTNFHVVKGAETITVTMESGEVSEAVLVGSDESNDIAVLKVDGENLPTVIFGESSDLQIGELAVAIGNPLGRLSGTVTAGIISALDRSITIDGQTLSLLQTDAAINSGNSGGALFNSYGEVIGINTAKNAGSGVEGLGFAIPIDNAKPVVESLIRYGYVRGRTKIGINTRDVTAQMALYYQLPEGVYVVEIDSTGPAYEAGVRQGDIIVAVDGEEIKTAAELLKKRNAKEPGDELEVKVVRNNVEKTFSIILIEDIPADANIEAE